jgi:2,4'-dihydroxyacetophenone dioxygenase
VSGILLVSVDRRAPHLSRVTNLKRRLHGHPDPAAGTEFWRDIKPIPKEKVFRKDAAAELFLPDTMADDDRYFVPLSETVFSRPLWISLAQNRWADVLMAKQAGLVNRHYHPHQVFGYTLSGKWSYLEHDWVATAGTFVYEAPGEAHTLVAHESPEPMRVHFNVTGPLIWLDENGEPNGTFDAYDYLQLAREHYEQSGLGVEAVHKLLR